MIYLLYGNKEFLIKEEIKKIGKKIGNLNKTIYDLDNDPIEKVLDDSTTISLFEEKKMVIAENANLFTPATSKDSDKLEKYLNNPNPNTILIFTVNNEKIDSRKKITKRVKEIGEIKEFNDDINASSFVKKNLSDYQITQNEINLLIDRVGENPLILANEIEKIKLYKDDDKIITKENIINLTNKKVDTDIFKLIDSIVKNDKNTALEIYHEMLKMNEEPIKIIILLANQFKIMYQAKELYKSGLSEKDIASILGIHPYRIKLAIQNGKKYSSDLLLNYLSDLADLDINIKTGKASKDLALELFILKK